MLATLNDVMKIAEEKKIAVDPLIRQTSKRFKQ